MTAQELIKIQPSQVRNSNGLMAVYLQYYYSYLGRNPVCTSCTFDSDFRTFAKAVQSGEPRFIKPIETTQMESTFKILDPSAIYSYRPAGASVKRCYGSNMSEEFAIAYLTNGTDQEIEMRKKQFKILPVFFNQSKTETIQNIVVETQIEIEPKKRGRKAITK